ncbi:MAG: hypothetical protein GTO12_06015, partial [Proteobacteria bacterium]|nr:hypothetical protein [Pseudomonadota bacterium]
LVECAALRRAIELAEKEQLKAKGFLAKEGISQSVEGIDDLDLRRRIPKLKRSLRETVNKYEAVRIENIERLSRPRQERFPFEDLAEQCGLGPFEQDVVWLLFLKAVSPDFQ